MLTTNAINAAFFVGGSYDFPGVSVKRVEQNN